MSTTAMTTPRAPAKFTVQHAGLANDKPYANGEGKISLPYRGQPYFVSEFGGTWWNPKAAANELSWGWRRETQES